MKTQKTKLSATSPPKTPTLGGLASSRFAVDDNNDSEGKSQSTGESTNAVVTPESEHDNSSAALASVGEPFFSSAFQSHPTLFPFISFPFHKYISFLHVQTLIFPFRASPPTRAFNT